MSKLRELHIETDCMSSFFCEVHIILCFYTFNTYYLHLLLLFKSPDCHISLCCVIRNEESERNNFSTIVLLTEVIKQLNRIIFVFEWFLMCILQGAVPFYHVGNLSSLTKCIYIYLVICIHIYSVIYLYKVCFQCYELKLCNGCWIYVN